MKYVGAIIIVLIIIWIVVWIVLRATNVIKPDEETTPQQIQEYIDEIPEFASWTDNRDVPGGRRNTCAIYTFPAQSGTEPPNITLDEDVLNNLTPDFITPGSKKCIDPDQIVARQQERECLATNCIGYNGRNFVRGQVQTLYVPCDAEKCKANFGLVAIDFSQTNFPNNDTRCLEIQNNQVVGSQCNIQNMNQVLRIDRTNPTRSSTITPSDNGPFARFVDRETGLCIIPDNRNPTENTSLTLGNCLPNSGYVWFLVPRVEIQSNEAPQQIVYTTDISSIPSPTNIQSYISQNNPLSIQLQNNNVVLDDYATEMEAGVEAQILNYQLYNFVSSQSTTRLPFFNWSS